MTVHVLGGGPAQLNLIRLLKDRGHKVAVSDMNPDSPGLALADFPSPASSFDPAAVAEAARTASSDCLLTLGTDQPVLTAALVSEELDLPYFLSSAQARLVTNKKDMKQMFLSEGIPTAPFRLISPDFKDEELEDLNFPLVIKPLDSQGQRGVLKVRNTAEIRDHMQEVLGYSRECEILAEEYYPSEEITLSGWVYKGNLHIFSITDRVTIENDPYMGVCISHRYPSVFHQDWDELESLSRKICHTVGLQEGAVYFQILGGEKGFFVNEIACRLGGAYEDEFLPALCGVDPLELLIDQTTGEGYNWSRPEEMTAKRQGRYFSLQMFFCRPGKIMKQSGMDQLLQFPGTGKGRFLLKEGTSIGNRENSTQRAGYFFIYGNSPADINKKIDLAYESLEILDEQGRQMIELEKRMYFPQ
ncbi:MULTISPECIES: ATP-grasp domain-containing protein [unclassified Oceanispirochaeta]|uniref:ATP-grasp domain-containing protein n=1 Tax=unclassified Oceanispirochaeta TaxID=2635722 RepID=UPI000E08D4FA|nr:MULTISPECIES: ATP-grasp domain-containing protein [unclassified Oceanispirochaeta]MBF9014246.1 ATP-grasp domain-containing protein [Oceanispirochaeta sp. M2]NPD71132.1 ATP-grasp domain-containing protein [Oceanispirochaeta sp. M1]RDG33526.1 ATP-grasp domain-containing protein [Oceanispirochaeta sp. M1]